MADDTSRTHGDAHRRHAHRQAAQEARQVCRGLGRDRARTRISVVDGRALTRLRIAFVLLAAALLAPLALLARSMELRFEAQRRLRHEIVAERIFDEMERELTALLATESARPTEAYNAASTRV